LILGAVTRDGREAAIDLVLRGPPGGDETIRAVIDTGFDGSLTVESGLVARLGLLRRGRQRGVLADGQAVGLEVYEAIVEWDGRTRRVLASLTQGAPLVGMALLRGYELTVQVTPDGPVRLTPLALP